MKLNGTQFGSLQNALLSAFPTPAALQQLVRTGLGVNPHAIGAGNVNIKDAVFDTLQWVESRGLTSELIVKALQENPTNPDLKQVSEDLVAGQATDLAVGEIEVALRVLRLADARGKLGALVSVACTGVGDLSSLRAALRSSTRRVADLEGQREALKALAREYGSVRASMTAGPERTRRMSEVESRMRAASVGAASLVREFAESELAGERLVAVAILEEAPDLAWLDWLAARVAKEKPFVGYHAAIALRSAARLPGSPRAREVAEAVAVARRSLGPNDQNSDRAWMLDATARELQKAGFV